MEQAISLGALDEFTCEVDEAKNKNDIVAILHKHIAPLGFTHCEFKEQWGAGQEKNAGTLKISNQSGIKALFVVASAMSDEVFARYFQSQQHGLHLMATYAYEKFLTYKD